MMPIEPGDVLLVPFPFTDQSAVKQRPAVVISSREYNDSHPDVILAPITGRFSGSADEVVLISWREAGLAKPSAVKPLLASFDASLVRRKLGQMAEADLEAVRFLFARILFQARRQYAQNLSFADDRFTIELADGRTISIPLAWFPRLFHATPTERGNWRWIGGGIGIHWPDLDEDIAVEDLLLGRPSGESQESLRRWLEQRSAAKE